MPSVFPGAIDSFVDPLSTSPLSSPSHALQHQNINDAVEKVETYMGLIKIVPTSATNGTVGATGTVTIGNAVSSVTVNGAFSALYDNYLITLTGGVASATGELNLTLGATVTGYYLSGAGSTYASNAYVGVNNNNSAKWQWIGGGSSDSLQMKATLYNPFVAKRTTINASLAIANAAGYGLSLNGFLNDSTSYSSFNITAQIGTMTGGTIRVYGYRN